MSFTEKKFSSLSEENKLKKIIFAIHSYIDGKQNPDYINNLLIWYNRYENKNLGIPKTLWEWKILSEKFLQTLGKLNTFIEKVPIDNKNVIIKDSGINLLLSDIRSPYNVGAIIRNCDAFNVDTIYISGITPDPKKNSKTLRTAMNSTVNIKSVSDNISIINQLKEKNYYIYALEKTKNSKNIYNIKLNTPLLLILGNEEFGLEYEILKLCNEIIHIPMLGNKNSLNVSVASGIALSAICKNFKFFNNF